MQEATALCSKFQELLKSAEDNGLNKIFLNDKDGLFSQWLAAVTTLEDQPFDDLQPIIELTEKFLNRAVGKGLADSRRAFSRWASTMWRAAPGALHRHVKGVQAPRDEHTDDKGSTSATPCKIMDRRAESWEQIWSDQQTSVPALIAGLEVVLAKAKRGGRRPDLARPD